MSRETHSNGDSRAAVATYDTHLRTFQREQKMPEHPWSEQATSRVAGPDSMSDRDKLRYVLDILEFALK